MYKFNKRASLTIIILRKGTCGHSNQHAISSRVDPWVRYTPWVFKYKYVHLNLVYKVLQGQNSSGQAKFQINQSSLVLLTTYKKTPETLLCNTNNTLPLRYCCSVLKAYTLKCILLIVYPLLPLKAFRIYEVLLYTINLGNVITLLLLSV